MLTENTDLVNVPGRPKRERVIAYTCRLCGGLDIIPHEKMTDVNIAVEMMRDAFQERFDTALLLSADSDLCPPVRMIRELFPAKRVVVGFPPHRRSAELVNAASNHFVIGKGSLAKSQFPPEVVTSSGTILRRPETWAVSRAL